MTAKALTETRQLLLWRHAKSDWSDPGLADHDRPLAPRGKKAAKRLAHWIIQQDLLPERVLCSSAIRTRQTLDYLSQQVKLNCIFKPCLYHAEPEVMLNEIAQVDDSIKRLMLVGHNPGFEELVWLLNTQGNNSPISAEKIMPTGALAIFQFNGNWRDIASTHCQRLSITRPRELQPTA